MLDGTGWLYGGGRSRPLPQARTIRPRNVGYALIRLGACWLCSGAGDLMSHPTLPPPLGRTRIPRIARESLPLDSTWP